MDLLNFSLDFIAKNLKEYHTEIKVLIKRPILIQKILLLNAQQTSFQPDVLYIGKVSDFPNIIPENIQINLICIEDTSLSSTQMNLPFLNLLLISGKNEPLNIFNQVYTLLQENMQIAKNKEQLMNCLKEPDCLQSLVDITYELLGNPVAIIVPGFKILACTNIDLEDEGWSYLLKTKQLSPKIIDFYKHSKEIQENLQSKTPTIIHTKKRTDIYYCNVFNDSNYKIATIVLYGYFKAFDESDPKILSFMSQLLSIKFQKRKYNYIYKARAFEFFLHDLLAGNIKNEQEIQSRIKHMKSFRLKQYLYVLTIRTTELKNKGLSITDYIDNMYIILRNSYSILYDSYIITLISRESTGLTHDKDIKTLSTYLKKEQLSIGVSLRFKKISAIQKYFKQGQKALEISNHLNDKQTICRYENYALHHFIEFSAQESNILDMCHPSVISIKEYDEKNGTNLLESLYYYLEYDMSITNAANAMHVHRNTLNNRIVKIKNMLDIDWKKQNVVKHIFMSLRILEYDEKFSFRRQKGI